MVPDLFEDKIAVVVVADSPAVSAQAASAIAIAGARLLAVVSWFDIAEDLNRRSAPAILLMETEGAEEQAWIKGLSAVISGNHGAHAIISFTSAQLEGADGVLLDSGATLLCDATPAERVGALVSAVKLAAFEVADTREETARMARINAEIARFTETLTQLAGNRQGPGATIEREPIVARASGNGEGATEVAASPVEVRKTIRARRLRDEVIGTPGLFEDPAWDMMLDLFAAELEQRQVSVSSLCIAAAVAPTTALRWINKLISVGLFERRPDDYDRRRAYVVLTERAVAALNDYIATLRRAGLSIA